MTFLLGRTFPCRFFLLPRRARQPSLTVPKVGSISCAFFLGNTFPLLFKIFRREVHFFPSAVVTFQCVVFLPESPSFPFSRPPRSALCPHPLRQLQVDGLHLFSADFRRARRDLYPFFRSFSLKDAFSRCSKIIFLPRGFMRLRDEAGTHRKRYLSSRKPHLFFLLEDKFHPLLAVKNRAC